MSTDPGLNTVGVINRDAAPPLHVATLPQAIQSLISDDHLSAKLLGAFACGKCNAVASTGFLASQHNPGRCVQLQCKNKGPLENHCEHWFACFVCEKRVSKKSVKGHFRGPQHIKNYNKQHAPNPADVAAMPVAVAEALVSDKEDSFAFEDSLEDRVDSMEVIFEYDDASTGIMTGTSTCMPSLASRKRVKKEPKLSWIEKAFTHVPNASIWDVIDSFGNQSNMSLYFSAEHAKEGGGLQHMATRMFRRSHHVSGEIGIGIATMEEATWHFLTFAQYMSMNTEQRRRQASLTTALNSSYLHNKFFRVTRPLCYEEMNRYYGRSNQHTMWNSLPVPTTKNIDGIAYVRPIDAIRFLVGFSTEVDEFMVDFEEEEMPPLLDNDDTSDSDSDEDLPVYHIHQSKSMQHWRKSLLSRPEFKAQFKRALLLEATDWRDGFGSNRTKQNRKSTTGWTFNLSAPRNKVNGIDNTVPIALGLKKNQSWCKVEQEFRNDMAMLGDGNSPLMVYHGGLRKVVPVFVRRIACLTDKVERSEYTATLSCTSSYHRWYGKIFHLVSPLINIGQLERFLDRQRTTTSVKSLRSYGWSIRFVDTSVNGGVLPACLNCRKANIRALGSCTNGAGVIHSNRQCKDCADWTVDDATSGLLKFAAPKGYPTEQLPNPPVDPPNGREVGLAELEYIDLNFDFLKNAARFAFFNCCVAPRQGWTKAVCKAYLRTCGVPGKQQDDLYAAARKAFADGLNVDYEDNTKIGGFDIPAAWSGELAVWHFIEMVMHLLFLGIAESNFDLANKYLVSAGTGEQTFKKATQELLVDLTGFNLAWFLVLPFNGSSKTKLTTGTWVSENWLAWVRLSKIVYVWFTRKKVEDERRGSNDVLRLMSCFNALVARVCSHGGVTESLLCEVDCLVKELLSAVRELDIRVRYKEISASKSGKEDKEPFWFKSNYMSLRNLVPAMRWLGPLVNFWDGGGKGEKYIQEVKPHISTYGGVRSKAPQFYPRLLERVYKHKAIQMIESKRTHSNKQVQGKVDNNSSSLIDDDDSSSGSSNPVIEATIPDTVEVDSRNGDVEDQWSSPMEDEQMSKARTVYIYRRRHELDQAIGRRPISFLVLKKKTGEAEGYAVYKQVGERQTYMWCKVVFNDASGINCCGLWYASLHLENTSTLPPKDLAGIKNIAKMSAVAIPLR